MWHLAYDTYPIETRRRNRSSWLARRDEGWSILWNHDPRVTVSRVVRDAKREFVPVDPQAKL